MEYKNDELQVKFTLPDHPTVKIVLQYDTLIEFNVGTALYIRLWMAARDVIDDWECPHAALDTNLDEAGSPEAIEAIKWAGLVTFGHFRKLNEIPKN